MLKKSCLFLLVISLVFPFFAYAKTDPVWIRIDLHQRKLYLMERDQIISKYKIAIGKEKTPTPVGTWQITNKKANWGSGFGSRWLQLNVPWGVYGIHGTKKPYFVGKEASKGCIRLFNRSIEEVYKKVPVGTRVVIEGPIMGFSHWELKRLHQGHRGTVVYYVQQKLKEKEYYNGKIDGLFGQELRTSVMKFQKDNHLEETGMVYTREYARLGLLFK